MMGIMMIDVSFVELYPAHKCRQFNTCKEGMFTLVHALKDN